MAVGVTQVEATRPLARLPATDLQALPASLQHKTRLHTFHPHGIRNRIQPTDHPFRCKRHQPGGMFNRVLRADGHIGDVGSPLHQRIMDVLPPSDAFVAVPSKVFMAPIHRNHPNSKDHDIEHRKTITWFHAVAGR